MNNNEKLGVADAIEIYAEIDGVKYCSIFDKAIGDWSHDEIVNQELVNFAVELIEISPVKLKNLKDYVQYYIK